MNNTDDLQSNPAKLTEPGQSTEAEQQHGPDGSEGTDAVTSSLAAADAVEPAEQPTSEDKPGDSSVETSVPTDEQSALQAELERLRQERAQLTQELSAKQAAIATVLEDSLASFKARQAELQRSVEQLERRRDSIHKEMRENFVGTSQELALRVQGFKEYLVGSLQDLASAADNLELVRDNRTFQTSPQDFPAPETTQAGEKQASEKQAIPLPEFAQRTDIEQEEQIRAVLERYRTSPDYYGPPWQLRRTFEPVHEALISKWFFDQGGRGAVKGLGSRLQNILVASSAISVLNEFYGDRCCALILANSPERLGDWRRGLQECLGISRQDFGPNQGIVLCESPDVLVQRAERMLQAGDLPVVILDESELFIDVSLLRFPIWLAFAPDPAKPRPSYDEPFGPERQEPKSSGLFEGPDNLFERAFGGLGLGRDENPDDRSYGRGGGYGGDRGYGQSRYDQASYGQQQSYDQPSYGRGDYDNERYSRDQNNPRNDYPGDNWGADDWQNDSQPNRYGNAAYGSGSSDSSSYGNAAYGDSGYSDSGYGRSRYEDSDYGSRREPRRSRYSEGDRSNRYGRDDANQEQDDWF